MAERKEKFVSVREFLRNYKKFASQNKVFIISRNGKPEKVFLSFQEWEKLNPQKTGRKINIAELEQFMFDSGDPHLSEKVDEIYDA